MRRTIFSQTAVLCGMFLPLFLAVAANNLFATNYGDITVNGGKERTIGDGEGANDTAKSVTVRYYNSYPGFFYNGRNGGTGTVGTATVNRGDFYNGMDGGTGNVGTATVDNYGYFYNGYYSGSTGTVGTAIVYNGRFNNGRYGGTGTVGTAIVYDYFFNGYSGGTGKVGTATLNGGWFLNGNDNGTGTVGTVTLNGGWFLNGNYKGTGTVGTVTLNGGAFYNGNDDGYGYHRTGTGTVGTATLNSGAFINGSGSTGTVGTVTLNGGTFINGNGDSTGNVDHLIYNGGDYRANVSRGTSSLGKLTLGTKVSVEQGAEFMKSNLKELAFSQDYGVINITGTADAANHLAFTNNINVSAPTIDLTGTNIAVDVAALLTGNASSDPLAFLFNTYFEEGFSLASLFNGLSTITGGDDVLNLLFSWGSGDADSVHLIANGDINSAAGFSWANETRTAIAWTLPETSNSAATPEPATLALFGLGIAGLAAMRRRQR